MNFLSLVFLAASLQPFAILDSFPHSENHFTQGLFFDGKNLVETTGLNGHSKLYRYDENFTVKDSLKIKDQYFGEGSALLGEHIFWLTWRSGVAWKIDRSSLKIIQTYKIPTEGWGLTFCAGQLLLSDGSDEIFTIAPDDFSYTGSIRIQDSGRPIRNLNELECVNGKLFANIWQSDSIAIIKLPEGKVEAFLDFSNQASEVRKRSFRAEVLNGIASDGKFIWVTGKFWPVIYKIKLSD